MDYLNGSILTKDGFIEGYVCIENNKISEIESGKCPEIPIAEGIILPLMVNAHTHCADSDVKIAPGMSIEELVAPPNGLKHQYLKNATDSELKESMKTYAKTSYANGIETFIDFREGGEKGCRLLREAVPDATILGRPVSPEYDSNEIDLILKTADGIGISSISDMNVNYIENIADQVRKAKKIFAIHVSERIREDIDTVLSMDPTFVVHMVEATDSDLLKCAEAEVPVVVCTTSNMYFKKIPPINRMIECGIDVAIGTDNAMLCRPDLRSEASVFSNVLVSQGGNPNYVWKAMINNGRKLLYHQSKIHLKVGMDANLSVMPCSNTYDLNNMLSDNRKIFRYEKP